MKAKVSIDKLMLLCISLYSSEDLQLDPDLTKFNALVDEWLFNLKRNFSVGLYSQWFSIKGKIFSGKAALGGFAWGALPGGPLNI